MKSISAEQFVKDTENHQMAVKLDSGVYRHLQFRRSANSWNMWFEIITWPGSLAINGDMGTWCFSRIDDMFNFFRSSRDLHINESYWQEKIQSESRFGGPSRKFDPDKFKANVISSLDGYDLPEEQKKEITEALEEEVFGLDDEHEAARALANFELGDFKFSESWEIDGEGYSFHFVWCLYAIVWAIQQYDAAKTKAVA